MLRAKALIQWLLLTLLLLGRVAFATPTLAESPFTAFATSPVTITFSTSQAVGNVIECGVVNTSGSVITGITAADSSSGSYGTPIATASDSTNNTSYAHFWKVVTSAGAPTVTITSGSNFLIVQCNAYTGFTGTPTVDASMTQTWGPFGASSSFSFSPIVTGQSNEIVSMIANSGSFISSTPSGWSSGGASWPAAYKIAASSGTSATFAGSLNASSWISGLSIGIYDASPGIGLAIDGTPVGSVLATGSTFALPGLSTTHSNDVITVYYAEDGVSDTATTVTSAHLTFTKRATAPGSVLAEWVAVASAPLTSEVITVTLPGSASYFTGCAFGVSGANTGTIWDAHAGLPVIGNTAADPQISTASANTIIIAGVGAGASTPTSGSGWTTLYNGAGGYFIAQYKIVTSPQTNLVVALGTGTGTENRYVADAVVSASSGPSNSNNSMWFLLQ